MKLLAGWLENHQFVNTNSHTKISGQTVYSCGSLQGDMLCNLSSHTHFLELPSGGEVEGFLGPHPLIT